MLKKKLKQCYTVLSTSGKHCKRQILIFLSCTIFSAKHLDLFSVARPLSGNEEERNLSTHMAEHLLNSAKFIKQNHISIFMRSIKVYVVNLTSKCPTAYFK